jgi:hypothetical protein
LPEAPLPEAYLTNRAKKYYFKNLMQIKLNILQDFQMEGCKNRG